MSDLKKDSDDKIFATIKSTIQTELCHYVILNGERFNKETAYASRVRKKETDPVTGHIYGCNCFICNH